MTDDKNKGTKPSYPFRSSARPAQKKAPLRPAAPAPTPTPAPALMIEEEEANLPPENLLLGRNPVREALRAGRDMEKLLVQSGEATGSLREILNLARENGVFITQVERKKLDELGQGHQGVAAYVSMTEYADLEDLFEVAAQRGEEPFFVVLDGITDPHNLGAIIRTAECAGAHGVIIPERRAVGMTPAAMKAAAGALEWIRVARVKNIARTIEQLKERNVWTYAAAMNGMPMGKVKFTGGCALVIGAEGDGVSRLVMERCDQTVSIPMRGRLDSLNASVAAGVLLYEVLRQKGV